MATEPQIKQWAASEILRVLADHRQQLYDLGVRKLGLFGSYAREEQTADSDMDFVVVLNRYTFDVYMDVKFYLEDLFRHEVDLAIEKDLKPAIRPHVLREVRYVEGF